MTQVRKDQIKDVNYVSIVDHGLSVLGAVNVFSAAQNDLRGGRLLKFWQKLASLGFSPMVVFILKDGCTQPFKSEPL